MITMKLATSLSGLGRYHAWLHDLQWSFLMGQPRNAASSRTPSRKSPRLTDLGPLALVCGRLRLAGSPVRRSCVARTLHRWEFSPDRPSKNPRLSLQRGHCLQRWQSGEPMCPEKVQPQVSVIRESLREE
jgi:hypothetical protein